MRIAFAGNPMPQPSCLCGKKLPEYKVSPKQNSKSASAAVTKKVGVYHTHNDESYFTPDGIDSVYGKGGIHDVGKSFVSNLEKLGITTLYREDLHLPHNSGAYTRSQVTASALLESGATAILICIETQPKEIII